MRVGALTLVLGIALAMAVASGEAARHLTVDEVASEIMSPVCPGKLLIHCPSSEGAQIRRLVQKQIDEGKSKEEILSYLMSIYGQEVLPKPPFRGFFLSAWVLPFAGLLSGAGLVIVLAGAWARRRRSEARAPEAGKEKEGAEKVLSSYEEKLDNELKKFDF
ncbi:MAG: cytochrome c-type biogenesis protein CcmH [Nitrospinota bacterium]